MEKNFNLPKHKENVSAENNESLYELAQLANQLPCDQLIENEDIHMWCNKDAQMELSDDGILHIVNNPQESDTDDITPKVSHSDGLKAIDAAIAYIEQQEEFTPHYVLT
ncbi:hypothetical protein J6590_079800 [Homalodisca vitripennis]|nr:hypothetical protein J6590_079800 [Homalodisca vitripennis]